MATACEEKQSVQALFEAKHGELVAEADGVAREFGVDVVTVAFRPCGDGAGAVVHEFPGARLAAQRLVARDVAKMGPAELGQHEARLLALRAAVVRKLQKEKIEDHRL